VKGVKMSRLGYAAIGSVLIVAVDLLISVTAALAQRTYTWEEICKQQGLSTGPCAPKGTVTPATQCLNYESANAFHANTFKGPRKKLNIEEPVIEDVNIILRSLSDIQFAQINSEKFSIVRARGAQNAAAFFDRDFRCILVDPDWARVESVEAVLVVGHELGHHLCRHPIGGEFDPKRSSRELEADWFSGFAIRQFERKHFRSLSQRALADLAHLDSLPSGELLKRAIAVATRLFDEHGSSAYPPRAKRIEAINSGYATERPCK
jgi:hypothetical protein